MFLIMGVALTSLIIGRQVFQRRELQTAGDAAALAAAHAIQQRGLPFNKGTVKHYITNNSNLIITGDVYDAKTWNQAHSPIYRRVIKVDLTAKFLTLQKWLPKAFLNFSVRSHAQFNEQWFGEKWPIIYFIFDASHSMTHAIAGGSGKQAWDVLKETFLAYAKLTLPARNGVLVFAKAVESNAKPPTTSLSNLTAIKSAMNKVKILQKGTNTNLAFDTARKWFMTVADSGKNIIFLTDGTPKQASGCPNNGTPAAEKCAQTKAIQTSDKLRKQAGVTIFGTELRHKMSTKNGTERKFLIRTAGMQGSNGNNAKLYTLVSSKLGIEMWLTTVVRSICTWDKLKIRPGAPPDAYRLRRGISNPDGAIQRLFAFLWDPVGGETPLVKVTDTTKFPNANAFEVVKNAGDYHIALSRRACEYMGKNPSRRLIVRWDQPQLSKDPSKP